jgi:hypothetical protein
MNDMSLEDIPTANFCITKSVISVHLEYQLLERDGHIN